MKTRSVLSAAFGSFLFAWAIMLLIPTLASATFQDAGRPPRVSQAIPPPANQAIPPPANQAIHPMGQHLSAQQMKATQGAFGAICDGDCNPGIDGCDKAAAGGGSYVYATFFHHLICVPNYNITVYSTCNGIANMDCYDYVYHQGTCQGPVTNTVQHMVLCCGS